MITEDLRPAAFPERVTRPSVSNWMQALCMQGGLTVEGDETDDELAEAIVYLVETNTRG